MVEEPYTSFCHAVLQIDNSVRIATVANEMGNMLAIAYRKNLSSLLSKNEIERFALTSVINALTRQMFQLKTGRLRYAAAVYEKFVTSTVPIELGNNYKLFLLVSLDTGSDYKSIIEDKVLLFISRNKRDLLG